MKHAKLALLAQVAALALAGGMCGTASAAAHESQVTKDAAVALVNQFNTRGGQTVTLDIHTGRTDITPSWYVLIKNDDRYAQSMIFDPPDYYRQHPSGIWANYAGVYSYPTARKNPVTPTETESYFVSVQPAGYTSDVNICLNKNACVATAKLNYDPISGTTQTDYDVKNVTLTVGAAYLYAQYVLGASYPNQFPYAGTDAWTYLTYAVVDPLKSSMNWNSELERLLVVNNPGTTKEYWLADYDPGKFYDEMQFGTDYYSVFVMNLYYPNRDSMGNLLFVARMPVPEPETYAMLLAGLGLIGVVARRRSMGK